MVTVRRIRVGDGALLRALRLAALEESPSAFGSTLDAEAARTAAEWEARAALLATGDDAATWFAIDDAGDMLGLVGAHRPGDCDEVELVSMWTAPSARGAGVARRLVETVLEWAQASSATRVALWVTRGNEPAQRLYRSMGFVETGDHQPLPSDPCKDELRMMLRLRPPGEAARFRPARGRSTS